MPRAKEDIQRSIQHLQEHPRAYVLHAPLMLGMVPPGHERRGQLHIQHPRNDLATDRLYSLLLRGMGMPRFEC